MTGQGSSCVPSTTSRRTLIEESIIVAIVCIVFLFHFRSALVGIFTLPVGVFISFIIMHGQGINANIMSLGGIAIAIGAMVDGAIVMIENAHKHIEHDGGKKPHWELITDAAKEVGPALFFSLLIIAVSFLPVFTLEAQEGRLFKPLAYTKTYAMMGSAVTGHHHRAHTHGLPDPGKNKAREQKSGQSFPHLDLPSHHQGGAQGRRPSYLLPRW